jgi:hypothetical protein
MLAELSKQSVVLGGWQEAAEAALPEAFEEFDEHNPVEAPRAGTAAAQAGRAQATGEVRGNMVITHKRTARGALTMWQYLYVSATAITQIIQLAQEQQSRGRGGEGEVRQGRKRPLSCHSSYQHNYWVPLTNACHAAQPAFAWSSLRAMPVPSPLQ